MISVCRLSCHENQIFPRRAILLIRPRPNTGLSDARGPPAVCWPESLVRKKGLVRTAPASKGTVRARPLLSAAQRCDASLVRGVPVRVAAARRRVEVAVRIVRTGRRRAALREGGEGVHSDCAVLVGVRDRRAADVHGDEDMRDTDRRGGAARGKFDPRLEPVSLLLSVSTPDNDTLCRFIRATWKLRPPSLGPGTKVAHRGLPDDRRGSDPQVGQPLRNAFEDPGVSGRCSLSAAL